MTLTDENRAKLSALWRTMRLKKVTKREVMQMFGVGERVARDMLSEVAKRSPVIALSDGSGYRIVDITNPIDVADARHAYNENRKRAEEILKRNDALARVLGLPKHAVMEVLER